MPLGDDQIAAGLQGASDDGFGGGVIPLDGAADLHVVLAHALGDRVEALQRLGALLGLEFAQADLARIKGFDQHRPREGME